ncbi:MAG: Rpn family recombination-promoting nuclease/putative transposase [Selenomonas sp.]|jgi:predicted transposase/invertase (TIGR01784 family)|nr:Rpn family recombination-promoting nuclease/putative transposase [Selenomonas sp.]
MEQETYLAHTISQTSDHPAYDAACKKVLADKQILAWILRSCTVEFQNCSITDIAEHYIEGMPDIAATGVCPDDSGPNIHGASHEDNTLHEGTIYYDIRFSALAPGSHQPIPLILNIEAQNDYYPGYPLIKRAVYYGARLISSQYGTEFQNSNYQSIKKACSIWICTNVPKDRQNSINRYALQEQHLAGNATEEPLNYDLINITMIGLSETPPPEEGNVLNLLSVLLLQKGNAAQKKQILQNDFQIAMTTTLEQEVDHMCNLSEGIERRGIEKGIKKGIKKGRSEATETTALEMLRDKMDMNLIMKYTKLSLEKLTELGKLHGLL